jgi:hypothetical protein
MPHRRQGGQMAIRNLRERVIPNKLTAMQRKSVHCTIFP